MPHDGITAKAELAEEAQQLDEDAVEEEEEAWLTERMERIKIEYLPFFKIMWHFPDIQA